MHSSLLFGSKWTRLSNAVAAGTTDINSSAIDMEGFTSVVFATLFGTITSGAATSLKVQAATDSAFTTPVDLVGPTVTVLDTHDNMMSLIEVIKPQDYRYLRLVVDRGTQNAVVDAILAAQVHSKKEPTSQDSTTVLDAIVSVSPKASDSTLTSTTTTFTNSTTRSNMTRRNAS